MIATRSHVGVTQNTGRTPPQSLAKLVLIAGSIENVDTAMLALLCCLYGLVM